MLPILMATMKHLFIFLLTLISFTASAQITNNTAWYKFAQKLTVGGKLQIPNDTLTLTAQDTGLVAIVGDKFYIAAVIGGTLQWGEVISGGGGGGITAGDTTAMLANYFNQAIRSGDSIIFYNDGVRLAGVYSPITGGAVWGGITGDPSDQADLQALLNAKQATLVSGTNIKTINGTTLLGSGDISITSSSALSALTAATATNTINNAANAQEWQWNSKTTGFGLKLSTNATTAGLTEDGLLAVSMSGANSTSNALSYGVNSIISRTGTNPHNYGVRGEVTGGSTVSAGLLGVASGGSAVGVYGSSVNSAGIFGTTSGFGAGVQASNTGSGPGVTINSVSGSTISATMNPSSTNTITDILVANRTTSGTAAASIGGRWSMTVEGSSNAFAMGVVGILKDVTTNHSFARIEAGQGSATQYGVFDFSVGTVSTLDNTPTTIKSITIPNETIGILEISITGKSSLTDGAITGKKIVRYVKNGGTLTLGTPTTVLADELSGDLSTASWTITTASNQVIVQGTGENSRTIAWKTSIKLIEN